MSVQQKHIDTAYTRLSLYGINKNQFLDDTAKKPAFFAIIWGDKMG